MKQIKTLQAQLSSIIPDDDNDDTDTNVGEESQVDVSSVLHKHYYPKRTSVLSVPSTSRRTSLSSIESISSAPAFGTPATSSLPCTVQSVELAKLGRSSSVADDKSDDNNNNSQSVNCRPKFRPSRLSKGHTTSRSTSSDCICITFLARILVVMTTRTFSHF